MIASKVVGRAHHALRLQLVHYRCHHGCQIIELHMTRFKSLLIIMASQHELSHLHPRFGQTNLHCSHAGRHPPRDNMLFTSPIHASNISVQPCQQKGMKTPDYTMSSMHLCVHNSILKASTTTCIIRTSSASTRNAFVASYRSANPSLLRLL